MPASANMTNTIKAPFPWLGGKSRIASEVWSRFGDVPNYVEPFAGSLAALLARPADHRGGTETVNDADGLLCVAPETNILRSDLMWTTAGQVRVGDELLGFDESNGTPQEGPIRLTDRPAFQPPTKMRHWRVTRVLSVKKVVKPSYRLTFDDGTTVVCSADHLWLGCKNGKGTRGARWLTTKRLRCDDAMRSYVTKLVDVVHQEQSHEAGWLGGFYDGEGSIRGRKSGWRLTVCQRLGPEADRVERLLQKRHFRPTRMVIDRKLKGHSDVAVLEFNGGMRETLRLLMLTRPERLIRDAIDRIGERSIYGRERQVVGVVSKEFLGDVDVIAIETDSHTYIAEGLASHNCNFWRAVTKDPDAVAHYADWPCLENDLHARHAWLIGRREDVTRRLEGDPDWFDAKTAGWWVWGLCLWIGTGWCESNGPWRVVDGELLNLGDGQKRKLPHLGGGRGINRKRPHLGNAGMGINRNLPILDSGRGACDEWSDHLRSIMRELQHRLRRVRVCCGDWSRVCGPTPTVKQGLTAVFLDPPYAVADRSDCYAIDSRDVANDVREWAIANGDNPQLRIALCGYDGEHVMPDTWRQWSWKAHGGYGSQGNGQGRDNARRERVWFSPHCLSSQLSLFDLDPSTN